VGEGAIRVRTVIQLPQLRARKAAIIAASLFRASIELAGLSATPACCALLPPTCEMQYYNITTSRHTDTPLNHRTLYRLAFPVTIILLAFLARGAAARPLVVTSIKPLSLLVQALSDQQVQVQTLLPAGSSPHTYQMRPSDRRRLSSADLVVWIGPRMETFLQRVLGSTELTPQTLSLAEALGVQPGKEHKKRPHDSNTAFNRELDPHLWLDPRLIPKMALILERRLSALPGVDAEQIHEATTRFLDRQSATIQAIRSQLTPLHQVSLFAYHDAFRRYADGLNLKVAGVLTLNPQRAPGARHLSDVEQALLDAPNPCLVTEPEFSTRWWRTLAASKPDARRVTWDPLASDVPTGQEGFILFEQAMAGALAQCLPGR